MTSYETLMHQHNFSNADWVSTWADSDDETQSAIACMILHGHGEWKVSDEVLIKSPRSFTVNNEVHKYESSDHAELLDVHGHQVIFRYGMPDSIWYKKSDEQSLFLHVMPA